MHQVVIGLVCVIVSVTGLPRHFAQYFPDGRIVGGDDANITDYPYQISLQYKGRHVCGGSIVGEKWVVTAAHTFENSPSDLSVRTGSSFLEEGGEVYQVAKVHQNSNFTFDVMSYDISILELSANITLNANSAIIGIIEAKKVLPEGVNATITGWGVTQELDNESPRVLQVVSVPIISYQNCKKNYADQLTDTMICAGDLDSSKDSCQGDSGGPLVVDEVLAGVVSWGNGCGQPGFPGVYSNLAVLRDYVTKISGI